MKIKKAAQIGPLAFAWIQSSDGQWAHKGQTLQPVSIQTFSECPGIWLLIGGHGFGACWAAGKKQDPAQ